MSVFCCHCCIGNVQRQRPGPTKLGAAEHVSGFVAGAANQSMMALSYDDFAALCTKLVYYIS